MRIAHVMNRALVHRTPARIAHYWGRYYAEHSGIAIVLRRNRPHEQPAPGQSFFWQELTCPGGYLTGSVVGKKRIYREIMAADVIHMHDDAYPNLLEKERLNCNLKGKVLVYHAHIGSIPERYFHQSRRFAWDKRVKHCCITNGYGRLFDEDAKRYRRKWYRLPDVLDLDHPAFRPEPSLRSPVGEGKLRVVYTYSNQREGGKVNAKRPVAHARLMRGLRGVKFEMCYGWPFELAMALKKRAHIVLEEVFTPYLHLSALEGAAVGAMVLTNFDEYTKRELCQWVGSPISEFPFYRVTPDSLRPTLTRLRKEPEEVSHWGERGLRWMRKYYEPRRLLDKFLEFYQS